MPLVINHPKLPVLVFNNIKTTVFPYALVGPESYTIKFVLIDFQL